MDEIFLRADAMAFKNPAAHLVVPEDAVLWHNGTAVETHTRRPEDYRRDDWVALPAELRGVPADFDSWSETMRQAWLRARCAVIAREYEAENCYAAHDGETTAEFVNLVLSGEVRVRELGVSE